ncbi:MAG TPA: DivIVA domain-containing protein [Acidimicrobiia bacterium]|jgi:cell division initiation protein|nr:DivIVA domain-containing protein [Acidimicrobiia bacterium]
MDVTPHDLRNAELREAFRGYRPDEVEELLERAALTLERMHERNRQLQEKIAGLEAEGSTAKEMESVLRQTLLLAQRTADETVTAAHEKSRQLVEDAEDRSMTLTSEAEEQARIIGEAQRQKYEAIVSELSARRDLLTLDIDALERVQADYRGRLRAVLEKELEELDRRAMLPTPARPELHEIDLSAVPVPPTVFPGDTPGPPGDEPEVVPQAPTPQASTVWGPPPEPAEETEGGPPTEALVVLDEELADSGPSGASSRRRA